MAAVLIAPRAERTIAIRFRRDSTARLERTDSNTSERRSRW
jgi:hypothetical protein